MKLLIVDDSELLLDRLATLLADIENLEIVGTAENALEGKTLIDELNPDLLLTDIRMPGGGGIELIENLKSDYPNLIKIVYTNYPYPQYEEKCRAIGADYFFHKGSDAQELYNTIEKLCTKNDNEDLLKPTDYQNN